MDGRQQLQELRLRLQGRYQDPASHPAKAQATGFTLCAATCKAAVLGFWSKVGSGWAAAQGRRQLADAL